MLPSQLLKYRWAKGLTLILLLSAFSFPVSAVAKNENNRLGIDAEWTLRQESATNRSIPKFGRLAQIQTAQARRSEALRLNEEGDRLLNRGQSQEALEKYQQALAIIGETRERRGEGIILNNMGDAYRNLGQYEEAIEYYQRSLAIRKEVRDRAGEVITLNNIGDIYRRLGKNLEAIEYLQQALAIAQDADDLVGEGAVLNNLGNVYRNLGRYPRAIQYLQQALAIAQDADDLVGKGRTLDNLGMVYHSLGEYPEAIEYYNRALGIFNRVDNRAGEGSTLNNLGVVYRSLGKYPEAIQYYQQALAVRKEVRDRAGKAATLNNLALVYRIQGEHWEAIEYYQQALAILKEVRDRAGEGITLGNLGGVYHNLEQYPKAIEYYQQALAIHEEVGNLAGKGTVLNNLGGVYRSLGQYDDAEQNLYAAVEVLKSLRDEKLDDPHKISLFETQAGTYQNLQLTLLDQNKTNAALEVAEQGRARAFVELLAKQLNPQSNEPLKIDPPSIEDIKQIAKAQNATLVQYALISNTALYIWVIQPTGEIHFRNVDLTQFDSSLAEIPEIERLKVFGLPGATQPNPLFATLIREEGKSTFTTSPQNQRNLYQLLIAPIADILPTNPEDRVIFIPHRSLFYVPFPALQDEEFNYLIEKHTILTAPSIQVLQLTRAHRQRIGNEEIGTGDGEVLVVGNPTIPDLLTQEPYNLPPLNFAEEEAQYIAQLLKTKTLIGSAATETEVVKRLHSARIIHLATHGLLGTKDLRDKVPGLNIPGLVALASSEGDDGLLTSGEIVSITQNNPLNAEIVVLSACGTGLGDLSEDGIIGLSRSLITAGVPSIMVSLWDVSDVATGELMRMFYANRYEKKMDKAQALRQAMLNMIQGDSSPSAWAAFTLIGEAE
ncbi:tetratricopeptide repeat protein [Lusitaniella coriacea]|uniref:CHAT domain-containing protein n=1 Tax=Lusitaniella coriacea TaxID=1983105 RepID=UPI003CF46B09